MSMTFIFRPAAASDDWRWSMISSRDARSPLCVLNPHEDGPCIGPHSETIRMPKG